MNAIQAPTTQSKRNKRLTEFEDIIDAIEVFENHEEIEKWKRYLVCGLYRFENGIAVNISTLKQLIHRCKSSINGSLKDIGYVKVINKAGTCAELIQAIPYLQKKANELRQWTIRYKLKGDEKEKEKGKPKEKMKDKEKEKREATPPQSYVDDDSENLVKLENE